MSNIVTNLARTVMLLAGAPVAGLFAYDAIVVRPNLAQVEAVLATANPADASPPRIIRDLIDANTRSPSRHATRLIVSRVYPDWSNGQRHVREALWSVLLPIHLDKSQMYGLYSSLSYNGVDQGLSSFARREYGKSLGQLSPIQAATTVAITGAPSTYLKNRLRLDERARLILERSGHGP